MSTIASSLREVRASYAFIERNFNLSKRYLGWEVVFLTYSVVQALAILYTGDSIGGQGAASPAHSRALGRTILFLAVGALVWSYLSTVFEAISETITWERWEGTIEYTLMAPISRVTHLVGSSAFSIIYSLMRTSLILIVLGLFFHIDLSHANPASTLVVVLLGSFSFMGIGIMAATLPLLFTERGAQMTFVVSDSAAVDAGALDGEPGQLCAARRPGLSDGRQRGRGAVAGPLATGDHWGSDNPPRTQCLRPGRAVRQADRAAQKVRVGEAGPTATVQLDRRQRRSTVQPPASF